MKMGDLAVRVIKYNSTTTGRDKVCRIVQYTARLLKYHAADKALVAKCLNVETTFATTRKVLRLGRSLDLLQGAVSTLRGLPPGLLRLCLVVNKLGMAAYLLADHVVLAARLGFVSADRGKNFNKIAARFWLIAIVAGLVRNIHDIARIIETERRRVKASRVGGGGRGETETGGRVGVGGEREEGRGGRGFNRDMSAGRSSVLTQVLADRPVVVDMVKNMADVVLPLSTLGYISPMEGFQALMGIISSYMGLLATWDPALKLSPA